MVDFNDRRNGNAPVELPGLSTNRRVNNYMDQKYGKGKDPVSGEWHATPKQAKRLRQKDNKQSKFSVG